MDIITTPTTDNRIAVLAEQPIQHKPLAEFITLALAACGSESENTRRAYLRAWGDFLAYLGDVWGLPRPLAQEEKTPRADGKMTRTTWAYSGDTRIFGEIAPSLRDGFTYALADNGLSRNTRNQRKNAVNTLLAVAYRDGFIADDQARRLDVRPYKRRERHDEQPTGRRLKPDEVRKLRAIVELKARHDLKATRDLAILDLMLFAGLRRDEAASLTPGNFRQDGGRWWIVLSGKGQKTRRIKLHDALYKSLAAWLGLVGLTLGEGEESLFCNLTKGGNSTGKALNSSVIGRLVGEYSSLAGLGHVAAHDLRRTAARNAYDNGASLLLVQTMLGHADPKTTTRYIGAHENDDDTAIDYVRY